MQKILNRDLLSALVLFIIGAVALANAGADPMNWAFPLMATYFVLFAAAALVVSVVFSAVAERATNIINVSAEDRIVWLDVFIFFLIALGYLLVMHGIGFWLSSFLMLSLASVYLTQEKTRRNLVYAVVAPLATCILAYYIFIHVFYVPVPEATWWPFAD